MKIEIDCKRFFTRLDGFLNERDKRLISGAAAMSMGYGSVTAVSKASGVSRQTIYAGIKDFKKGKNLDILPGNRQRSEGGGRKHITNKTPKILEDLDSLIKPYTRGKSPLRWTSKSLRKLAEELKAKGHKISYVSAGCLQTWYTLLGKD